jgi:hypothetical protein
VCRPEALVLDVLGSSAGAARVRAGRRDGANVACHGTSASGTAVWQWSTELGVDRARRLLLTVVPHRLRHSGRTAPRRTHGDPPRLLPEARHTRLNVVPRRLNLLKLARGSRPGHGEPVHAYEHRCPSPPDGAGRVRGTHIRCAARAQLLPGDAGAGLPPTGEGRHTLSGRLEVLKPTRGAGVLMLTRTIDNAMSCDFTPTTERRNRFRYRFRSPPTPQGGVPC